MPASGDETPKMPLADAVLEHHDHLRMPDVVGLAARHHDAKWLERLLADQLAEGFGVHGITLQGGQAIRESIRAFMPVSSRWTQRWTVSWRR